MHHGGMCERPRRRIFWLLLGLSAVAALWMQSDMPTVHAAGTRIAGFTEVSSERGVGVYRKGRDYLLVVRPSEGGRMTTELGPLVLSGGQMMYGRRTVPAWWASLKADPDVLAAFNGQFFDASDADAAPLAFSVKTRGTTERGYADAREYPGAKAMLVLGEDAHSVVPYTDNADQLASADASDAVVGLLWWADKKPRARVARTLIGVSPRGDTYVFVSPAATQRYAMAVLRRFGIPASGMLMMDGGGSSQLVTRSGQVVPVKRTKQVLRKVPQVMVVRGAE